MALCSQQSPPLKLRTLLSDLLKHTKQAMARGQGFMRWGFIHFIQYILRGPLLTTKLF